MHKCTKHKCTQHKCTQHKCTNALGNSKKIAMRVSSCCSVYLSFTRIINDRGNCLEYSFVNRHRAHPHLDNPSGECLCVSHTLDYPVWKQGYGTSHLFDKRHREDDSVDHFNTHFVLRHQMLLTDKTGREMKCLLTKWLIFGRR